ncbi:uncharacterized protein LOC133525562 [Cydia pomonella]|uniref:uncharacterized protein LOC133525562 n=1 Tax=Cydia pomonella TaxID=82600 RepID=UPI002ADE04A1|nr:uncharacterized protein LOC133525562 [Cydia pomonella]
MSNTVQCNSCRVVINELLCYIQNKLSVMGEETLVRLCTSAFTSGEIQTSKSLLFESLPTNKRQVQRKGDGKGQRDINDIVQLMKTTEPDLMPIFAARALEKLPPVTFDHLDCTKLLKDMVRLQAELETVKANYVTQSDLDVLKSEFLEINTISPPARLSICKVNNRRGAWCMNSGPVGLSHTSHMNETTASEQIIKDYNTSPIQSEEKLQYRSVARPNERSTPQQEASEKSTAAPGPAGTGAASEMSHAADQLRELETATITNGIKTSCVDKQYAMERTDQNRRSMNLNVDDDGFETVTYRKKKSK